MLRVAQQRLLASLPSVPGSLDVTSASCVTRMCTEQRRWATKKAGGTVKNTKDSRPKYLGVKKFGGEWCKPGNIIIRQRGQKYRPGEYVGLGRDFTIWALVEGQVKFWKDVVKSARTGRFKKKTCVSIVPGKKPEKRVRPCPPWFQCMQRQRRREKRERMRPIREQNRLFLYKLPSVKILAAPATA